MSTKGAKGFEKFINKEPKGAKLKEMFRQEKRRMKAERKEAGRIYREEKYKQQTGQAPTPKPGLKNPRKLKISPKNLGRSPFSE